MPDFREPVFVERVLIDYFESVADVNSFVNGDISTQLPRDFGPGKRIQVIRNGGAPLDENTGYVDRALVQINSFGSTQSEAHAVASKAMIALARITAASHDGAVVSRFGVVTGPRWEPDPETDVPRYVTQVVLNVHPIGG